MGKQFTAQQFIEAIPGSGGIVTTIAKRVGCEWHTVKRYIEALPTVKQAYEDERESIGDLSESVLIRNIQIASKVQTEQNIPADTADAKWLLARRFKDRGYGEQVDVTSGGVSLAELMRQVIADRHEEDTSADEAEQAGDTVPAEPTRQSG
jgi:hypothetical protein